MDVAIFEAYSWHRAPWRSGAPHPCSMTALVPSSPAFRWKLAAWALAALGTADIVAVALTDQPPLAGWLLAGGWFVAAAACAFRASRLARRD